MDFTSFIIFFQWSLSVIKVFARRLLGANIVRPRKKERNFSFIILFCEEKYQKSVRRTRAVLLPNHRGVHELVAQAMRGKCVRQMAERKPAVLPLSTVSAIPRERT